MQPNWFVGIPVTIPDLDQLLVALPKSCQRFHASDLHLTIAFLGPMTPQREGAVREVMKSVKTQAFAAELGKSIALPRPERPSALCVTLGKGHAEVVNLIHRWRAPLLEAGHAGPDHRAPLPHITLARPRRKLGKLAQEEGLAWLQGLAIPSISMTCDRLTLYTWHENRSQRLFKPVFEYPLLSAT